MAKCCECCCCKKKVNFKIYIPSGTEVGSIDVYGVDEKEDVVSEFVPNRVRDDWNSSDESEDPDYSPSEESDIEAIYENSHLSKEEQKELEEELKQIILEQDNPIMDGSESE